MKLNPVHCKLGLLAAGLLTTLSLHAQTATFTNLAGGNWNTAANWDLDGLGVNVVPAEGTNANLTAAGAVSIDYNAPMLATSFGSLTLDSGATLNINAGGFSQDLAAIANAPITIGAATLNVNAAGVASSTNGGTVIINSGGVLNVGGIVQLAPLPATGALTVNAGGQANVTAGGSLLSASGNFTVAGAGRRLYVNGGLVGVTNGNITFTGNGGGTLDAGTLFLQNQFNMGTSGAGNNGFFTNNGGTLSAATTRINPNNLSSSSVLIINGGTNDLGNVSMNRSGGSAFEAIGREGLVISNGLVRMTSLNVGGLNANSHLSCVLVNGTVTNTGSFVVSQVTSARAARFLQLGGLFVSTDPVGARVAITNNGTIGIYSVLGGTNILERFVLGDLTNNSGTVNLTNAAKIYLGSGGIVSNTVSALNVVLNNGGNFGANADWTGNTPIILAGGAFDCADLGGTPRNITLNGVLRGTGALSKNGTGTLTLNAANTYSGNTLINQGTLALGASGSSASSPQIITAAGATFDVSAVAGYTVGATRTLAGDGTVAGNVAMASGGIINPGTSPGTLTLANSLTQTGGAVIHFDLPTTPGPGNDRLNIGGDLNASGVNTLEVVGGGSPGTVHTLIQYGGNFNGTLGNFAISGAAGSLSNNATTKTISLIVAAAIRAPTNVTWVGNALVNDWDTVNRTNWLNTGTSLVDFFVTGDNALFNNTGVANPIVNIVGNNAPSSVTIGATANYTFGGPGSISGSTGLTKTNSGTLTITNQNTYSGATLIAGGVLEAGTLANAGAPCSIGSAGADPTKLVLDGGTLRYAGATVSIDRPATINAGGGTIDVATAGNALSVGALSGAGALIKAGAGQLTLPTANTHAGGTIINNGTLQLNNNTAAGSGGGITNNSATLRLNGAITVDNVVNFSGPCAVQLSGVGANNVVLRGAWSGSGTVDVTFLTQDPLQTFTMGGNGGNGGGHQWDFSGTVNFGTNSGFARWNNNDNLVSFGSSNATFNLGTGDLILFQRNGGTTTHLGALVGGPNTKLSGRRGSAPSGTTTYSIGGNNASTVFAGQITNGLNSAAVIKVGSGTLTLTGPNPYGGSTIVEAGTLQVDGSISTSAIGVLGGTLSGNGALGGPVDVQIGGTLAPGASIGQLTISNTLSLGFGCTTIMELNKSAGTNDSIAGLTGVNYAGTLVVTNLAGSLQQNDTFVLFAAQPGTYTGAFDAFDLPTLPTGLSWDTTGLLVDGSIKVSGATLNVVNNGTSLDFSWTGAFKLQAQTNSLNIGISNNWFDYPGGNSSPVTAPINPTNGSVFFRLISQ